MSTKNLNHRSARRQRIKGAILWTLAAAVLPVPGILWAQDGIRELRDPTEMAKVPPVRAIGIRLTEASPIDPIPAHSPPSKLPPTIVQSAPSGPLSAPSAVATPAVTAPLANGPLANGPLANGPGASEPLSRKPERVLPSPKTVAKSAEARANQPIRIQPQPPIRLSLNQQTMAPGPQPSAVPSTLAVAPSPVAVGPSNEVMSIAVSEPYPASTSPVGKPPATPIEPPPVRGPSVHPAMSLDIVLPDVPAPTPTAIDISPTTEPTFAIDTLAIDAPRPAIAPAYTAEQLASAIRVELESQSAREFEVDTPIQSIMVVDETVCRTVARDGRMYLVGIQTGETMIEVQPTDGSPSRWVLAKVVSPWQRSQGPVDLDQLTHAIQPLSPDGLLNIRAQEDGSIVVRGKVDSKETAKRIMELTRKMILVPVVDKLEIR